MDSRKPIDGKASLIMIALCLTWGMQQVALKAVAADMAPMLQIAVRSGIAALLVAALMFWRGQRIDWSVWRPGILVGALFALEYLLVGEALRLTSASHTTVFLYTAPIFAALGLHWKLPTERLNRWQWTGIFLAFAGVAMAFLGKDNQAAAGSANDTLLGDLLALLGGAAWGATTIVIRTSRLSHTLPTQTLLFQLAGAFLILSAASMAFGQAHYRLTPVVWANLLFQTVIVSFLSFLAWFWLLRHYLASRLGVFTFMTPVFTVALGAWLLHEPLERQFLLSSALVLVGITVVSSQAWLAAFVARPKHI